MKELRLQLADLRGSLDLKLRIVENSIERLDSRAVAISEFSYQLKRMALDIQTAQDKLSRVPKGMELVQFRPHMGSLA